tara:strand:- start:1263 stop:1634 length:372 start_codon:yes stop_codon:yes gene_type:complete
MRVKITRTTDVSRLAGEIRRMMYMANSALCDDLPHYFGEAIRSSLSNEGQEFFSTIENIDEFRKRLADYDESLQEIQNILTGYKSATTPPEPEKDQEWADQEQAKYERDASRHLGTEEDNEEG